MKIRLGTNEQAQLLLLEVLSPMELDIIIPYKPKGLAHVMDGRQNTK